MDIEVFREMAPKKPDGFLSPYGLGDKIMPLNGDLGEAAEHLRIAIRLDPVHGAALFALGRALIALGHQNEAKSVLSAGIDASTSGRSNGGGDLVPEMQALLHTFSV